MIDPDLIDKLSTKLSEILMFDIKLKENPEKYGKEENCFNLETKIISDPNKFGILRWMFHSLCMVIQLDPYPDDGNTFRGHLSYHFKPRVGSVKHYDLPMLITWSKDQPKEIHIVYNKNLDSPRYDIGTGVTID